MPNDQMTNARSRSSTALLAMEEFPFVIPASFDILISDFDIDSSF
jgi:hypothetical protein